MCGWLVNFCHPFAELVRFRLRVVLGNFLLHVVVEILVKLRDCLRVVTEKCCFNRLDHPKLESALVNFCIPMSLARI